MKSIIAWLFFILLLLPVPVMAAEIRVAVASNFMGAMRDIVMRFEQLSGHRVILVPGSTGKHYAQIVRGIPVEVFLAADVERPRRLETEGVAVVGSRFTYALGRLVLWSSRVGYVDSEGEVLARDSFTHLAIANPRLAPYGVAARQILVARGLWQRLQGRLVRGESIAQAYQFVKSGNAELGFIARAQLLRPGHSLRGSWWEVPQALHARIEQQVVLIRDVPAARALLAFLRGTQGREIISRHGYDLPG